MTSDQTTNTIPKLREELVALLADAHRAVMAGDATAAYSAAVLAVAQLECEHPIDPLDPASRTRGLCAELLLRFRAANARCAELETPNWYGTDDGEPMEDGDTLLGAVRETVGFIADNDDGEMVLGMNAGDTISLTAARTLPNVWLVAQADNRTLEVVAPPALAGRRFVVNAETGEIDEEVRTHD